VFPGARCARDSCRGTHYGADNGQSSLGTAQEELAELTHQLAPENLYLENEIRSDANFKEIVGSTSELRRVLKLVETVAPTDSTALIYGETGTGKGLIARAIHDLSSRHPGTFVRLNCAAIPSGLLECELFGCCGGRKHSSSRFNK